jgi:hypothetical protein
MAADTQSPEEAAMAALRQVADINTTRSIKQTLLACLLIRSVLRPPAARRRTFITATSVGAATFAIVRWHIWPLLIHLLR